MSCIVTSRLISVSITRCGAEIFIINNLTSHIDSHLNAGSVICSQSKREPNVLHGLPKILLLADTMTNGMSCPIDIESITKPSARETAMKSPENSVVCWLE